MTLYDVLSIIDSEVEIEVYVVNGVDNNSKKLKANQIPLNFMPMPVLMISEDNHKIIIFIVDVPQWIKVDLPDGSVVELYTDMQTNMNEVYDIIISEPTLPM